MPELPPSPESPSAQPQSRAGAQWLTLAISSGAFAAFNGVFAKLTTTAKTHGLASSVSTLLGLSPANVEVEFLLRAGFFGLNLLSNAIMWFLFTRALTAGTSTTRVSIINTASNFMVTAVLSFMVFSEGLPLGWWAGAALLVAGSVVIGAREGAAQQDEKQAAASGELGAHGPDNGLAAGGVGESVRVHERYRDDEVEGEDGDTGEHGAEEDLPPEPPQQSEQQPDSADVERQCAVPLANGKLCRGKLTCKRHSMSKKRAVPGRSAPFDVLLREFEEST